MKSLHAGAKRPWSGETSPAGGEIRTLWVIRYPNLRFGRISLDYAFGSAQNDNVEGDAFRMTFKDPVGMTTGEG